MNTNAIAGNKLLKPLLVCCCVIFVAVRPLRCRFADPSSSVDVRDVGADASDSVLTAEPVNSPEQVLKVRGVVVVSVAFSCFVVFTNLL